MNWKGSASSLVTKRCIQIGRVSPAEYFQGAFGQKTALSAIEPEWLFPLVGIGRGPQVDALTRSSLVWRRRVFARTAPTNHHEGALLRRVGGSSQETATARYPLLQKHYFLIGGQSNSRRGVVIGRQKPPFVRDQSPPKAVSGQVQIPDRNTRFLRLIERTVLRTAAWIGCCPPKAKATRSNRVGCASFISTCRRARLVRQRPD